MSAVQIAGCSGAGKSTIAAELARRGLVSVDADDDPLLARFVDFAGAVVAEVPAAPDLAWLARHGWAWDPARLDELIRAAGPATLYVRGGADNQQEVAGRFTQVFLLEIDEPTMLARLDARRDYHDWSRLWPIATGVIEGACRHLPPAASTSTGEMGPGRRRSRLYLASGHQHRRGLLLRPPAQSAEPR